MSLLDSSILDACWWAPQHFLQHLPGWGSHLPSRASHLPSWASSLPLGTYLPTSSQPQPGNPKAKENKKEPPKKSTIYTC